MDEGGVEPGRILVLLRNNRNGVYSTPIIEALAERDLAAELPTNPFAVLDEPEGRPVVCLLRLLRDAHDGLAWRELLALRPNNVGSGALAAVYRLAVDRGERYDLTLQALADDPDLLDHSRRNAIATDVGAINDLLADMSGLLDEPPSEALDAVLDAAGFPEDDRRDALRALLLDLVAVDDEEKDEGTLGGLEEALHSSRGSWDESEREESLDRVQIMTMHTAKGLTADAVIVAACEEELVPGNYDDQRGLDDQRRLLYVSLTRARHFLFVTLARRRYGAQGHHPQVERRYTRFLRNYLPSTTH